MLLMFKEKMTDLEVQKIKGFLASMYLSIEKINEIERNIKQCRNKLGTKGIRYDKEPGAPSGITHDQRLIEMISKIDDLEVAKKIEKKKSRYRDGNHPSGVFSGSVDPSSYDVWIFVSGTENERLCQNV